VTRALYRWWLRLLPRDQLDVEALVLELGRAGVKDQPWPAFRKVETLNAIYQRIELLGLELIRRHKREVRK
jgi:hypothetical protein